MTRLLDAVSQLDYDEVKRLLANGADINGKTGSRRVTVLDEAAWWGHGDMVRLLLDHGAQVDTPVRVATGMTVFQTVVWDGFENTARIMIERRANVNAPAGENGGRTALQAAAEQGHEELVRLLIDNGAKVNGAAAKIGGRTALQAATEADQAAIVQLLIDKRAKVNAPAGESGGRTALQAAVERRNETLVRLLIDNKANIDAPAAKVNGRTALQAAAEAEDQTLVQLLIEKGANVNAPAGESGGRTALQAAVERRNETLVRLLIDNKANIDAPAAKVNGRTALQAAAEAEYQTLVQLLIEKGANVNAPAGESGGRTALQATAERRNETLVKLLVGKGADVNGTAAKTNGRTALQAAVEAGDLTVVQLLISNGADVNTSAGESGGRTALQAAAEQGNETLVRLLIENNANIDAPAAKINGRTVLQAAAEQGNEGLVRLLIENEADVNTAAGDSGGRTALQASTESGEETLVQLLIGKRADVNAPAGDSGGRTALQAAAERRNKTLVKLLVGKGADVNGTAAKINGRTALQAAVEAGDLTIVQLLISKGANVNAPAGESGGRTALQAAVEQKNEGLVRLLIGKGADAKAAAGKIQGTTALRAALEAYEDVSEENDGEGNGSTMTKIVTLLFHAGVTVPETEDDSGRKSRRIIRQIMSQALNQKDNELFELLVEKSTPSMLNAKDTSRLTPLHHAIRDGNEPAVKLLIARNINLEIKDVSGRTALHAALSRDEEDEQGICKLLLRKGAHTNFMSLGKLPKLFAICGGTDQRKPDIFILHDDLARGTYVANNPEDSLNLNDPLFNSPSICSPQCVFCESGNKCWGADCCRSNASDDGMKSFVSPNKFLRECREPLTEVRVHWGWRNLREDGVTFRADIPEAQDIIDVLIGYASFDCPEWGPASKLFIRKVEISWVMKQEKGTSFLRAVHYRSSMKLRYLAIPQNTVDFITIFLTALHQHWINCIELAKLSQVSTRDDQLGFAGKNRDTIGLLLADSQKWSSLRKSWQGNLRKAKELLVQLTEQDVFVSDVNKAWEYRRDRQSTPEGPQQKEKGKEEKKGEENNGEQLADSSGEQGEAEPRVEEAKSQRVPNQKLNPETSIAVDSASVAFGQGAMGEANESSPEKAPESKNLRTVSGKQKPSTAEPRKAAGREERKVEGPQGRGPKPLKPVKMEELNAMKKLKKRFGAMEAECGEGIAELEKETTRMVSLEFNLISIYEARRSLEASVSMKRLSWITFIFLPLMFISGIFGMNVNILQTNPAWQWYFVIAVPFSAMVIVVWIFCKYLPGIHGFERKLDQSLKGLFGTDKKTAVPPPSPEP